MKVQVGKDQEKVQSEKESTPKTEVGKTVTNNQALKQNNLDKITM